MPAETNELERWRRLFDLAVRVRQMAPWQWMDEIDVFGVQDPADGSRGFVSVMGALGEHLAISVYRDAPALYEFWELQEDLPPEPILDIPTGRVLTGPLPRRANSLPPEHILDIPQVQAMFLDRAELSPEDRDLLKRLGLTVRGRQSWPCFRSYRPGYMPWFLEGDEVVLLANALEQVLDVAPRFKKDATLLEPGDDDMYLVRAPHQGAAGLLWEDESVSIPPPARVSLPEVAAADIESLASFPVGTAALVVDFFPLLTGIQEKKGQRPLNPYMILILDSATGLIIGTEILVVETTISALWAKLPLAIAQRLVTDNSFPRTVAVRSQFLLNLLMPLSARFHFDVILSNDLPALDEAKASLLQLL